MSPSEYTAEDYENEWRNAYETRLGILCGTDEPSPRAKRMAQIEADLHIQKLKESAKRVR